MIKSVSLYGAILPGPLVDIRAALEQFEEIKSEMEASPA